MTEIEVGAMKVTNSCLICVLLMKMMAPHIVFELITFQLLDKLEAGMIAVTAKVYGASAQTYCFEVFTIPQISN